MFRSVILGRKGRFGLFSERFFPLIIFVYQSQKRPRKRYPKTLNLNTDAKLRIANTSDENAKKSSKQAKQSEIRHKEKTKNTA